MVKIHASVTADRVMALAMRRLHSLDDPGICLACGNEADGVEPDASAYKCEHCGEHSVYGAEEAFMCGYYHGTVEGECK